MTVYTELDIQPTLEIAPSSWANQVRTNQQHFRERRRYYTAQVVGPTDEAVVLDGQHYFDIPNQVDGMNLVEVAAFVITAGVTGTIDIQIHNLTQAQDMLSTVITIDSTETHSDDAAVPAVINAATDDVAQSDVIRIDVDDIHSGTASKGLIIRLGFANP